jgi:2-methylisocitrate lyase-like PEP mutase family enzyme
MVPPVYNALSARVAERVGCGAVGLRGVVAAARRVAGPDVGPLTGLRWSTICAR